MNKDQKIIELEISPTYPNKEDWDNNFWDHNYLIYLDSVPFAVNANCEQDALDCIIDYCEENCPGFIMTRDEEKDEKYLEDYICGGNHGVYLNTYNIHVTEFDSI